MNWEPAQLVEDRSEGIGASEAATALGLNPWETPWVLHQKKKGRIPEFQGNDRTEAGTVLEPWLAEMFERRTGLSLDKPPTLRSARHAYMFASLDFCIASRPREAVEMKAVFSPYSAKEWGEQGTDQIPAHYLIQCQHQIEVAELDRVWVAAFVLGEYRVYRVERHDPLIETIVQGEGEWWERFLADRPLPPEWGQPGVMEAIEAMHRSSDGRTIQAPPHIEPVVERLNDVRQTITALGKQKDILRCMVMEAMGTAGKMVLPDGTVVSRRWTEPREYSTSTKGHYTINVSRPRVPIPASNGQNGHEGFEGKEKENGNGGGW